MNFCVNGDFADWPRGADISVSSGTSSTTIFDDLYWDAQGASQPAVTISQEEFDIGSSIDEGYPRNYLKILPGSAPSLSGTDRAFLEYQVVEVADRIFQGNYGTFTFWAKAATKREVVVRVVREFGSGGSALNGDTSYTFASQSFNFTPEWRKYEIQVRFSELAGATYGDGSLISLRIYLQGGASELGLEAIPWVSGAVYFANLSLTPNSKVQSFDVERLPGSEDDGSSLGDFGVVGDGVTDDYAGLVAALAAENDITLTGTYLVGTNLTIPSVNTLRFLNGAKLKPASGVKISIYGDIKAGAYQIFDYSASGSCVFPITGIGTAQKNDAIHAEWYGAVGDNGSTNNATAFARITGGTSSENQLEVLLSASYYNFVTGITPKNKQTFVGVPGRLTRLQFTPTVDSTFITIATSAFDIRFKNVQISSTITSGTIRTTAIGVASDAHTANNINLENVEITGFNKRGIDVGAWIDCRWTRVRFENISNLAAYGGTGAGVATCVYVRTFLNASHIAEVDSSNCEQFANLVGYSTTIENCDHDQTSSDLDAITSLESFIYIHDSKSVRVINNYFEGIRATLGNGMVHAVDSDNVDVSFNYLTNLRGATNVASIFIKFGAGCHGHNAGGNNFKGSPGTAYIENNASSGFCTTFPENIFRDASDVQFITRASLLSRMSEAVTDMLLPDGMHWARPVQHWSITSATGITRPRKLGRIVNGGTAAANDGVGDSTEMMNASGTLKEVSTTDDVWTVATAASETIKKVFKIIVGGTLTTVFELLSTGIKIMGGPTITVGTGVPATSEPNGSLFLRTDGTGPNLYVRENGAWAAK